MRAKLKRLHSPDIDLASYWPNDPVNFGFLLQAMVGPEGEEGEESFDVVVCTPEWLKAKYGEQEAVWGRNHLIVFSYDLQAVQRAIARYAERCVGQSWPEIAVQMGKVARWELEDYRPG